jgi:hypothetical protein
MGSGVSYGMRYLLRMIFNLAVDRDDDGNAAGYRTRAANQGASISERAIAARVSQAWDGSRRTEPFLAGEAGRRDAPAGQVDTVVATDADIEARRTAVQLRNALPQPAYVIEPPRRRLQRELDKQRHAGNHWEAKIKAEQRKDGRFRQPLPVTNERNPPDDYREGGPGANGARNLDHTDRGGVPAFLDRRKPNEADDAPATYLDLVGGADGRR